jgi:multidrug resistance efflux pump
MPFNRHTGVRVGRSSAKDLLPIAKHSGEDTVVPPASGHAGPSEAVGGVERLERLKSEFSANAAKLPGANGAGSAVRRRLTGVWRTHRRMSKAAIGLLILLVVGWMPLRALFESTSTEAVVNARLITLRAPIEGQIEPDSAGMNVGTEIAAGLPMLRIVNRRADRGRLDDLRRLVDQLESEREGLIARITELSTLQVDLNNQVRTFQDARMRQLAERSGELASELAAAAATRDAAAKALARVAPMADSGSISKATMEKYTRDSQVTAEAYAALEHRMAALQVELVAAQKGTSIGDSYNDTPRSAQRGDEVGQRLGELYSDLRERDARVFNLRKELTEETKRFAENSQAELTAPVVGRVWEVLTAPGESVVRGQDLVRLLDCSGVVVTAAVSESIYNRLHIGQSATFRLRGEQAIHAGRVVSLTGVATAPANLAIQPGALAKEPYRVTVTLDDAAKASQCKVGRTGRVTFGE